MRRKKVSLAVVLATSLGVGLLWVGLAGATHHRYPIDAVTIKVDRPGENALRQGGGEFHTVHFCTSSNDWPLNVRMVRPGPDKKVAHTRTNFDGEWRFKVRSNSLKGKRLYAQVPSFPNSGHGYCVGARSRAVRAP